MKENFLNDKYYITIDEKELCFDSEELLGIFHKEKEVNGNQDSANRNTDISYIENRKIDRCKVRETPADYR